MLTPFVFKKLDFAFRHARQMSTTDLVELYADQLNVDNFKGVLAQDKYIVVKSLINSLKDRPANLQHYNITKKEAGLADALMSGCIGAYEEWTKPIVLCRVPRNVLKGQDRALCYIIFQMSEAEAAAEAAVEEVAEEVAAKATAATAATAAKATAATAAKATAAPASQELADLKVRLADTEAALKAANDRQIAVAATVALMHEHQKQTDAKLEGLINFLDSLKVVDKVVLSAYQHTTTLVKKKQPAASPEQQPCTIETQRITPKEGGNPAKLSDIVSFVSNASQKFGLVTHISDSGKTLTYLPLKQCDEYTFKTVKYIDTTTGNDLQCVSRNIYRVLNANIIE